jgi:hypothetical protein
VKGPPYDPEVPLNDSDTFLRLEREVSEVFAPQAWQSTERRIADTTAVLERIDRIVREIGARLVVVLVPDRVEVEEETRQAIGLDVDSTDDFDRVHRHHEDRLRRAGIPTIDLLAAFRSAPEEPHLYRRLDTQWSAAGNQLAADRIVAALATLGIPEP